MRKPPITRPCWPRFPIHDGDAHRPGKRVESVKRRLVALSGPALCAVSGVLLFAPLETFGQELLDLAPFRSPFVQYETTNSEALLQAVLELQGQLRSNQWAIEQNERQIAAASAQNSEALSNGLRRIESNFSAQEEDFSTRSARDLQAMQSSNRSMLLVAGLIAAIAFLGLLISGYFQWRAGKIWGEISILLPASREALRGPSAAALGMAGKPFVTAGPIEDASRRFLGAIDQLEKRIQRLEQSSGPARSIHARGSSSIEPGGMAAASVGGTAPSSEHPAGGPRAELAVLLARGQATLKDNDPEAALQYFDQALALSPKNPEVLVRKGVTLERLKKLSEAVECYDQAIEANATLISAYLRKGSLYNRMERFKEALECYERALQAQEDNGELMG